MLFITFAILAIDIFFYPAILAAAVGHARPQLRGREHRHPVAADACGRRREMGHDGASTSRS
jgi:hypothetical protein